MKGMMKSGVAALAAVALALVGPVVARAAPDEGGVYVVSHVDIAPARGTGGSMADFLAAFGAATREATGLLRRLADSCHKDAECLSFDVLQQADAPNHFTLLQHWTSFRAFEAHEAGGEVRDIRAELQPILGSPLDERVHHRLDQQR